MRHQTKVLLLLVMAWFAVTNTKAQVVYFHGWTPESESDLRPLFKGLAEYNETNRSQILPQLYVNKSETGNYNYAAGDQIFLMQFASGSNYDRTVAAHEFDHTTRSVILGQSFFSFVPSRLEEPLAEFFGTKIVDSAINLQQMPFRSRASGLIRTERWKFLEYPGLWALSAQRQEDPWGSCIYTGYCGEFRLGTYPLFQFVKAACPDSPIDRCRAYLAINEVIRELSDEILDRGQPFEAIRLEDIWQKLGQKFPNLRINGLSPQVFFGTSVILGPYREGTAYSITTVGSWEFQPSQNRFVETGPIGLHSWQFTATSYQPRTYEGHGMVIQSTTAERHRATKVPSSLEVMREIYLSNGVPVDNAIAITQGKFLIRLLDASGLEIETSEVDLETSPGTNFGAINAAKEPGLYKMEAIDATTNKVVAHSFGMVPPARLTWDYDGVFIWNIDEEAKIVNQPVDLPENWRVLYADNGLTQVLPPAGAKTVTIAGQEFTLTGESQILRLNGAYRWPVLENLPREIILSATQPNTTLELTNLNPNNHRWSWVARREYSRSVTQGNWLALEKQAGDGNSSLKLAVTKPPTFNQGEAWIYIQAEPGIDSRAVKVLYQP